VLLAKFGLLQLSTSDKISFVQSSAGPELTTFWDKESRINWETVANTLVAHISVTSPGPTQPSSTYTFPNETKTVMEFVTYV
jgi:hypothetical protein